MRLNNHSTQQGLKRSTSSSSGVKRVNDGFSSQSERFSVLVVISVALIFSLFLYLSPYPEESTALSFQLKFALGTLLVVSLLGPQVFPAKHIAKWVGVYTVFSLVIGITYQWNHAQLELHRSYLSWALLFFPFAMLILDLSLRTYVALFSVSVLAVALARLSMGSWSSLSNLPWVEVFVVAGLSCFCFLIALQRNRQNHYIDELEEERCLLRDELHALTSPESSSGQNNEPLMQHATNLEDKRLQLFLETARKELKRAQRYRCSVSVLMLNISGFNQSYQQFGPDLTDRIVLITMKRLKYLTRLIDEICHIREDQFVLLLPETDLYQALDLGERVKSDLVEEFSNFFTLSPTLSIRIGVASHELHLMQDIDELMQVAESAMNNCHEAISLPYCGES